MASSLFSRHEAAKKRYKKIKENPELYAKKLEQQRARYKKRTEEQKKKDKLYLNDWRKSMRNTAKLIGNCSLCFKEKKKNNFKMCLDCRIKMRKYYKKEIIISCTGKERVGMSSAGIKIAERRNETK
jgi:hypothetical protein